MLKSPSGISTCEAGYGAAETDARRQGSSDLAEAGAPADTVVATAQAPQVAVPDPETSPHAGAVGALLLSLLGGEGGGDGESEEQSQRGDAHEESPRDECPGS